MLGPLLILLAFLCALVASLTGFDWLVHADHPFGWLALSLVFWFASILLGVFYENRKVG